MTQPWHSLTVEETLQKLNTTTAGLTTEEVASRQKNYGPNELPAAHTDGVLRIFARQFRSPLIVILALAAVAMFLLGDSTDAAIIIFVLLFNSFIGATQEGRAAKTLLALRTFVVAETNVLRDGHEQRLAERELVPGDILILREGDRIPADCRILTAEHLRTEESALTGESLPSSKNSAVLPAGERLPADTPNLLWQGTAVAAGAATAVVVATGLTTMLGGIAQKIVSIDTEIPLKADIRQLSGVIVRAVVFLGLSLFFFGVLTGRPINEMFATVVSLAVSLIPEGLPIVITLVLSIGVWRMGQRRALVKKLQAVEALGQADILAVDKTGTVTENALAVREIRYADQIFTVTGTGFEPVGEIMQNGQVIEVKNFPQLHFIADCARRCATAPAVWDNLQQRWKPLGDPTEVALWTFSQKVFQPTTAPNTLIADFPFSSETKFHATISHNGDQALLVVLGAPENVLARCQFTNPADQTAILKNIETMAESGLRVLALATANAPVIPAEPSQFPPLTFAGLIGMADSLRQGVTESVAAAQQAGLRVVMITGDHQITAQAIATQAGIFQPGDRVINGAALRLLTDAELDQIILSTSVFARIAPEDKLRIVESFRRHRKIIAMTGDGVNDAPAIVAADLGIAMGRMGTEVAKEASDIVLLDDNFSTIVSAIEEGRSIFKTVKKVILYLFSTNAGEAILITGCLIAGLPLPLLPGQIIWLNLVTDTFLDVGLGMDPKEPGLLQAKFLKADRQLLDAAAIRRLIFLAFTMAIGTAIMYLLYLDQGTDKSRTIALTTLAVFQWFNVWNCRSSQRSIFQINPFSNPHLLAATAVVVGLHLLVIYQPMLQKILHTVPLSGHEWLQILAVASSILVVEEIRKIFVRRKQERSIKLDVLSKEI